MRWLLDGPPDICNWTWTKWTEDPRLMIGRSRRPPMSTNAILWVDDFRKITSQIILKAIFKSFIFMCMPLGFFFTNIFFKRFYVNLHDWQNPVHTNLVFSIIFLSVWGFYWNDYLLQHNLLCDNCHSHVALALNTMRYKGRTDWNMVNLATETFFKGKFIK